MYSPSDKPIKDSPPQSFLKIMEQNNKKPSKISNIKKFLRKYINPTNTCEISSESLDDFQIIDLEDPIFQK